jgi:hypothetical protein
MEVSGQLNAPAALLPGKQPLVPIGYYARWAPEPVWTRWWREKFSAPSGLEPPTIQPVVQRYTTELSHPQTRVLLEKLIVTQLLKKLHAFYGSRNSITLLTNARH